MGRKVERTAFEDYSRCAKVEARGLTLNFF
jgi:hypothetical protein